MYNKPLKKIPAWLFKIYNRQLIKSYPNYQPLISQGRIMPGGDRNCLDRWELIKREINNYQVKTVLDIGSAEGFYVLQAARECGCLALGVDADIRRLSLAQNQLIAEKITSAGFMLAVADEALLEKLPRFDLVIFLSVMHHQMYSLGQEYCLNFLKKLKAKIGQVMIFEMGQSNELKSSWARKLPDMGDNPHRWIEQFLLSAGFSRVTKIGESDSYRRDQRRAIFRVEP